MKKIKVAQIVGKLYGGGVEKVIFNYYRKIDKSIIQFDFFYDSDSTVAPPQDLIDMGAKFYKIPPYQKIHKYIPCLYRILKKNHYDIIHSNLNTLSVFPLFVGRLVNIPVRIAHNHSVPSGNEGARTYLKKFLRLFSKLNANEYFACSRKAGIWLFGKEKFDKGQVEIIYNAIFLNKFNYTENQIDELKEELGIKKDDFVVGHVGRLTFAKNQEFLIRVFSQIEKQLPNAKMLIVGDGELRERLVNSAKKLGLEKKIIFTGQSTQSEKFYSIMNVFILPSFFEGLSMATVEAQVGGVPVIVSKAVPHEANISNQFHQLSLEKNNEEEWAKAAIKFSNSNVKLNDFSDKYDITKAAPKLANMYKLFYKKHLG